MSVHYITDANGNRVAFNAGGNLANVEVITADKTLTVEDSGKTFLVATDALTITVPSTAMGLNYKFINSGAAANNIITISPAAADGIAGTITLAASVVVLDGTIDKDVINTKASSESGDSISILGTGTAGVTAWLVTGSTGIWAQEA